MTKQDLIDFSELTVILGYTDERSIIKWCKTNKFPVLKVGSKKYILSHYLTQYIDNQLLIFEQANFFSPNEVFTMIKNKETTIEKKSKITEGTLRVEKQTSYKPDNEIISKYLNKYESNNKSKAA